MAFISTLKLFLQDKTDHTDFDKYKAFERMILMKKTIRLLSVLMALIMTVCICLPSLAVNAADPDRKLGDANNDGEVGVTDATVIQRHLADMLTLTAGLDADRYMLVLDHQPNAYAEEAAAGADLVLSGHSHGGHLFPMGQIGLLMGANDRFYGTETRGSTHFVVTSGISGWGVPIKTGCASEVVLIDILPQ